MKPIAAVEYEVNPDLVDTVICDVLFVDGSSERFTEAQDLADVQRQLQRQALSRIDPIRP